MSLSPSRANGIAGAARSRAGYAVAVAGVIALGLASRRYPWLFPASLGKYPGDALWSLMVFLGLCLVQPAGSTARLAVLALAISFAVEFCQLYDSPWILSVRRHRLGHLVLGTTFHPPDLIAYAVGVACGTAADMMIPRRRRMARG